MFSNLERIDMQRHHDEFGLKLLYNYIKKSVFKLKFSPIDNHNHIMYALILSEHEFKSEVKMNTM